MHVVIGVAKNQTVPLCALFQEAVGIKDNIFVCLDLLCSQSFSSGRQNKNSPVLLLLNVDQNVK